MSCCLRGRALQTITDVENGYLQRADNRGTVLLDAALRERFIVREHLRDGRLNIHLPPADPTFVVGDEMDVIIGLTDRAMPEALFTAPIRIKLVPERVTEEDNAAPRLDRPKPKKEAGSGHPPMGFRILLC
ncbi:hypothetical protein EWE75_09370 [Sphingomonas populi]|uniref:Uncharacterized protein n=1 Tax=Sphingomonas populi TaxID=2484750 RepID=A0A4Q6Y4N3_9SPHN|nr:hypothetical protein [Sphingomonas populi]RZF64814.1 hypothetical protein EWE75_09370 [Sphingomonas populi]